MKRNILNKPGPSLSRFFDGERVLTSKMKRTIEDITVNAAVKYPASTKNAGAISVEISWNRSRLQAADIKVKIFHSINGDRRYRGKV